MDFDVLTDFRVKIKESKKIDKYWDLARELKSCLNMRVTVIAVGVLGTVPKDLEGGLEEFEVRGRIKTIQITALLRTVRILRRILAT